MKKYYLLSLLLAISSMTWADGYEVSYTSGTTENVATITQSESGTKTWEKVLAEANAAFDGKVKKVRLIGDFSNVDLSGIKSFTIDLSEATITSLKNDYVKYVVLPNGMSKEDVNSLTKGIGTNLESAASAQGEYSYSDGYKYIDPNTHNDVIVNASDIITKTVKGVTYGLLTGTYTVIPTNEVSSFTYGEGTEYNVTATTPVLISKDGKAWGINSDVSLIPIFVDSYYTYNNGTEDTRYKGTLFRTENSVKYGNTGESIALSSTSTGYTYSSNGKTYVYVGEDIYTNGGKQYVATSTPVSLTQKIEYHPYGPTNETVVNINDYTNISDPQYDENQKCSYVIADGIWIYLVPVYYNGDKKYSGTVYTKNEEFFGGEFAEASVIEGTVYYATSGNTLYTGKIYDGESLTGATGDDVALTSVIDYYTDKELTSLYEGPVTDDYKGVSEWETDYFKLTATYTYTYKDLAGVVREKKSDTRLNSITLEGDELYIALESVQIASAEPTAVTLTAYVVKPGTLVYTLLNMSQLGSTYYDWLTNWYIDNENGYFKYQYSCEKVKKLILSGNLNAIDMNFGSTVIDKETGHYSTTSKNLVSYNALPNCKAPYLDLTDALFGTGENYHPEDMTLTSNYGTGDQSTLETVLLPTHESQNTIPYNFLSLCNKVKKLCIPYNYEIIEARAFNNAHGLTHIYTTDPRNKDADPDNNVTVDNEDGSFTFSANLKEIKSDGNQSYPTFFGNAMQASVWDIYVLAVKAPKCGAYAFQGDLTFGNNGFAGNWTHPIQRSNYVNSGHVMCKLHYPSMSKKIGEEKNYTDVTKVYTLADETGLVDGYGRPMMWPRHEEFYRTFRQATSGYIWGAWKEKDERGVVISDIGTDNVNLIDGTKTYNQEYQGWHEFVLTENYNVRPFDPQKYYKEYDEKDWYTLCVPYDLTKSQLLQALGVKAGNKVKTLNGTDYKETSEDVYPDVRTLVKVTRSLNSSRVIFTLSEKLLDDNGNVYDLELNGEGTEYMKIQQDGEDPVVIKGGYPYLVKSYWPKDDQIKKIGNYVMSVAESNKYSFNEDCKFSDYNYMLPTKEFKMIAINDAGKQVHKDAEKTTPAYYYFVGTYVQNSIPKYSYYLGKSKNGSHNFFRAVGDGIAWNIYSAIITPLSTLEYNLNSNASVDKITNIKLDVTDNTDDLVILAGESTAYAGAPLTFLLDENNGTVTGIKEISSSSCYADGRIYTLGGQFVGASFKGLPKGVYVKDGKKYVVK